MYVLGFGLGDVCFPLWDVGVSVIFGLLLAEILIDSFNQKFFILKIVGPQILKDTWEGLWGAGPVGTLQSLSFWEEENMDHNFH